MILVSAGHCLIYKFSGGLYREFVFKNFLTFFDLEIKSESIRSFYAENVENLGLNNVLNLNDPDPENAQSDVQPEIAHPDVPEADAVSKRVIRR